MVGVLEMRVGLWCLRSSPQPSRIEWATVEMPLASQPTVHHMHGRVHPPRSTIRRTIPVDMPFACRHASTSFSYIICYTIKVALEWPSAALNLFRARYFLEAIRLLCRIVITILQNVDDAPRPAFPSAIRYEWPIYPQCTSIVYSRH